MTNIVKNSNPSAQNDVSCIIKVDKIKLLTLVDYQKLGVIKRIDVLRQAAGWSIFVEIKDGRTFNLVTSLHKIKIFKKFESALDEIELIRNEKVEKINIV